MTLLEKEKKKLSVGKSEWRGERHASAPIFSSATACAGNNKVYYYFNRYKPYNRHSSYSIVTFDFAVLYAVKVCTLKVSTPYTLTPLHPSRPYRIPAGGVFQNYICANYLMSPIFTLFLFKHTTHPPYLAAAMSFFFFLQKSIKITLATR